MTHQEVSDGLKRIVLRFPVVVKSRATITSKIVTHVTPIVAQTSGTFQRARLIPGEELSKVTTVRLSAAANP